MRFFDDPNTTDTGVADAWFATAAYAGVDLNNIQEDDFAKVSELLREQRALARFYSSDPTSLEQSLASGELVAAITWNDAAFRLRQSGVPVNPHIAPESGIESVPGEFRLDKGDVFVAVATDSAALSKLDRQGRSQPGQVQSVIETQRSSRVASACAPASSSSFGAGLVRVRHG